MSVSDVKIGTQLHFGLGVFLFFVLLLAALAWKQTDQLWLQTKGLYDHPHTVRRAVDVIHIHVLSMYRDVLDLCLSQSETEREPLFQDLDAREDEIHRQFEILRARYLGPQSDLVEAEQAFVQWKSIRAETCRLLREGKTEEACRRTRPAGACAAQVEKLLGEIKEISEFAKNRGDKFYRDAEEQKRFLLRQLAAVVVVVLLLALAVTAFLFNEVKRPLAELTRVTEQFRLGKLGARCRQASANEFGLLAASFNAMADAIQTQMQINENAARLAGVMLREEEVHAFCRELLKALLEHTGSQVGAVYFLNEAKTDFERFESIGMGAGGRDAFSAKALEGELGAAVATRQIQRITEIPADTRFTFAAVSGDFMPREILTIPVLSDQEVTAVISLASIHAYDAASAQLADEIWSLLTARVNGVLAFRKINDLAKRLELQNTELEGQKRELTVQADELTGQNVELQMQKRQLDDANRLKSAFLSNMSHELRTPLNSVIALSGVLSRRLANAIPGEEYGYLEVIERNGKNLLALINDILDLSRIEAGREELRMSSFSLGELTEEIVAMLEPQAKEKGLALVSRLGEDLPALTSDPDKVRHILQNIIGNAVKFTESGTVEISAKRTEDELQVTVRDTGIGIAANQLPHIFDEFRQADDSTSRKYGGTGLGLAIARKYAQLLGGLLTVESELGKGSSFLLRLPLAAGQADGRRAEDAGRTAGARPAGHAPAPAGEGQRLLLVEDNEPAIIQLTDILQTQGYRVRVARNGKEALAVVGQIQPQAMILDLMMPEVDGFQVLKAIRDVEQTARLPVLILTAKHVTKEELSFLKGNHIHQLIQKGDINREGLLAAVAGMVAPPQEDSDLAPRGPQAGAARSESPKRRPAPAGRPVALVVEDNADNLLTLKALLGDRYRLIEALDGRAAVEQARQHKPDLILSDIALPVMDGFGVLAAVRGDAALCHIPVIAVTSSAMKGSREEILARGFDGYISKPIDLDALMKTIAEVTGWDG
jgi:signal transduction histidine kinase/CheY-like chemotaxis protein/HAMP domain-containing protein